MLLLDQAAIYPSIPHHPSLSQEQYEAAIFQFGQFMDKQPCHWRALSQLMALLRRVGKLTEAERWVILRAQCRLRKDHL
jgi:hypothetical protein